MGIDVEMNTQLLQEPLAVGIPIARFILMN